VCLKLLIKVTELEMVNCFEFDLQLKTKCVKADVTVSIERNKT